MKVYRQGDVALVQVKSLPKDCTEIAPEGNRIVLAFGETTGHAHAVYDHVERTISADAAAEIAEAAIARARLWRAPNGERYLEVRETVHLKHEEHSTHALPPGIYQIPSQVEYAAAELRRVED